MNARIFGVTIVGRTPLVMNSNSSMINGASEDKASVRDKAGWEREHYLDSTYRDPDGALYIPARAIKKALTVACKFVLDKPKGTSFKSFGPLVEAAMIIEDDAPLNVEIKAVIPWTVVVNLDPSKGPKGPRGPRTRPLIPVPWEAKTRLRTFDDALTVDVLNKIAEAAGWKVGLLDARTIDMGRCDISITAVR